MTKVLIVGGGFAGLNAAKILGSRAGVEVTLLDRKNHHLFQPLLYQVATAGLSPAEISAPLRSVLSVHRNVRVLLDEVTGVELRAKKVRTQSGEFVFDKLILACGAEHSYFGHPEWEELAPGLKTLEQATEIRRRILMAFENAERLQDPQEQKKFLTFVVVGGGPTGVELAGAIAEISRQTLLRDFRRIDPRMTRVLLIDAGDRLLAGFHPDLSARASRDLEEMGVQIWLKTKVTQISKDLVSFGEERVAAGTILWAAGVKPSKVNESLGVLRNSAGQIVVQSDLSLKEHPDVFVVGDQAQIEGQSLPGLATVAMQQGTHAARQILADTRSRPRKSFVYLDKGIMATIGRSRAVAQVGSIHWGGFSAWLLWLLVHVYYLIGFKNRVFVLWQWASAYLTFRRGARLILSKDWRSSSVDQFH